MAELVDALDSGSSDRKVVEVRVLSRAPMGLPHAHSVQLIASRLLLGKPALWTQSPFETLAAWGPLAPWTISKVT